MSFLERLLASFRSSVFFLHAPFQDALMRLAIAETQLRVAGEEHAEQLLRARLAADPVMGRYLKVTPKAGATLPTPEQQKPEYQVNGLVAVIPIWGILDKRDEDVSWTSPYSGNNYRWGTSYEFIERASLAADADQNVRAIVFPCDSPGGAAVPIEPCAASLFALRARKPTHWMSDDLEASAALYLGAQATEKYITPGGWIGSIGVVQYVMEISAYLANEGVKVEAIKSTPSKDAGSPYRPMTADDRALLQKDVDAYAALFLKAVARGRKVSIEKVQEWVSARGYVGQAAVDAGLVDAVRPSSAALIAELNQRFTSKGSGNKVNVGASGAPHPTQAAQEISPMAVRDTKDGADAGPSTTAAPGADAAASPPENKDNPIAIETVQKALKADRERCAAIDARAFPFSAQEGIADLVAQAKLEGWTAAQFSDAAVQKMGAARPQTGHIPGTPRISVGDETSRSKLMAGIALSIIGRIRPASRVLLEAGGADGAREARALGFDDTNTAVKAFRTAETEGCRGMNLMRIACICAAGALNIDRDKAENLAYSDPGKFMAAVFHTSSDFPKLFANVLQKTLLARYTEVKVVWPLICRRGVATDYKEAQILSMSSLGNFEELPEGRTPSHKTLNERGEAISVTPKGLRIGLSYQTLRNDDLNVFGQKLSLIGEAARRVPDKLLFDLLALNSGTGPTMSDGVVLYHANHNNVTTGAALSYAAAQLDWTAFRKQKDFGPDAPFIEVEPRVLLVPVDLQWLAEDIAMQDFVSGTVGSPSASTMRNTLKGRFNPVATPKLTGTRRYWFADANTQPAIEVRFLDGQDTPDITELPLTDPMAMEWQATIRGAGISAIAFETTLTNAGV